LPIAEGENQKTKSYLGAINTVDVLRGFSRPLCEPFGLSPSGKIEHGWEMANIVTEKKNTRECSCVKRIRI